MLKKDNTWRKPFGLCKPKIHSHATRANRIRSETHKAVAPVRILAAQLRFTAVAFNSCRSHWQILPLEFIKVLTGNTWKVKEDASYCSLQLWDSNALILQKGLSHSPTPPSEPTKQLLLCWKEGRSRSLAASSQSELWASTSQGHLRHIAVSSGTCPNHKGSGSEHLCNLLSMVHWRYPWCNGGTFQTPSYFLAKLRSLDCRYRFFTNPEVSLHLLCSHLQKGDCKQRSYANMYNLCIRESFFWQRFRPTKMWIFYFYFF